MSEREKILARIREALRVPAPMPGGHGNTHAAAPAPVLKNKPTASNWLPFPGENFAAWAELFRTNALELRAAFSLFDSCEEMTAHLRELGTAQGWEKVATHRGDLTREACAGLPVKSFETDGGYDVHELATCDAGITECDALIAQTGSVLVTNRSAGGRALSVLPPHHVVLARREQLLPDLPSAFVLLKEKYGTNYPSFLSFITGPSRTGDIERILVLGAHGPRELTILCF